MKPKNTCIFHFLQWQKFHLTLGLIGVGIGIFFDLIRLAKRLPISMEKEILFLFSMFFIGFLVSFFTWRFFPNMFDD